MYEYLPLNTISLLYSGQTSLIMNMHNTRCASCLHTPISWAMAICSGVVGRECMGTAFPQENFLEIYLYYCYYISCYPLLPCPCYNIPCTLNGTMSKLNFRNCKVTACLMITYVRSLRNVRSYVAGY